MSRLTFKKLKLNDFRNYDSAELILDGRSVVLTGANGAGKTNILEAISMLSPGRGLRGARLDEMTRRGRAPDGAPDGADDAGQRHWAVSSVLERGSEELHPDELRLGTGLDPDSPVTKRIVRIDGQPASGPGALAEFFSVVWLTPALDRLFAEGASQRRRFLDRLVLGVDPGHSGVASGFDKAMRERQRLLDDAAKGGAVRGARLDEVWLSALEGQMAEAGIALVAARLQFTERLEASIAESPASAFPKAGLRLAGALEDVLRGGKSALEAEDWYTGELKRRRPEDAAAGRALLGPGRSDLEVTFCGARGPGGGGQGDRAAKECSTGEQKALLVGIVLANARLKRSLAGGAPPILLLDEIAAHLDEPRREALFDELHDLGAQAFMTGTDAVLFKGFGTRAQYLEVANGSVTSGA
jgi:DNA replication and repair protein RecF